MPKMSFIRIKRINSIEYAYLVSNVWRKRLRRTEKKREDMENPKDNTEKEIKERPKKGSRQKVSKYLGKVVRLLLIAERKEKNFFEFIDVKNNANYLENSKKEIINDLVRFELWKRGFENKGSECAGMIGNEEFNFDLSTTKFIGNDGNEKRIVVEMNEGFLCKYTLRSILNFKIRKDAYDEREIGVELAKAFLEAGLNVPKEIFVAYFEKI